MANGECPFYESVRKVLESEISDEERRERLKNAHVESTLLNAIHLTLGEKAAAGDVQAAKYLRDTALSQPQCKDGETAFSPEMDLSALTDDELRAIAAGSADEE
ncbi:MAG: hypothetical protein IKM11_03150 [Oscillospiraceae bacterium]|nr:hypothetical protein [Oscillospiraceae bacterium]